MDYNKWIEFIDNHPSHFIWKEKTADGIQIMKDIDNVPENFKERVLASLDKSACYKDFDKKRGFYNINISINKVDHWVSIGFERTPKLEDLRIFVEMANHLDALLLLDGTTVITEEHLG